MTYSKFTERTGSSAFLCWITVLSVALSSNLITVDAFASVTLFQRTSSSSGHELVTLLFESSSDTESTPASYEPLSQAEISAMLDSVPVYAVTSADGLVPLKEPGNENQIAYFFFQAEMANAVYAPLKEGRDDVEWTVKGFPLGVIWYDLFQNPANNIVTQKTNPIVVNGVEYRLVPDGRELQGARNILQQSNQTTDMFTSAYNEIPIFMDQFLRLAIGDAQEESVPMYLGLQDLIQTCQQAIDQSSGEYQAMINILDLTSLVAKMQEPSNSVNFREATLIPPSAAPLQPPAEPSSPPTTSSGSRAVQAPPTSMEEMELPTATNSWDD